MFKTKIVPPIIICILGHTYLRPSASEMGVVCPGGGEGGAIEFLLEPLEAVFLSALRFLSLSLESFLSSFLSLLVERPFVGVG